ncbi:SIALI-17 repeat-containing surface protein [Streptococcus oralis]|nr:LPXTG cell surface protein, calx-beta domain-containing protein [Streptococcus oralis subsp. tigurinus AZ_3a]
MKKHFWDKSCRYSIRKLTVGTASVLLGAVFLVNHTVAADSVEVKQTEPTSVEAITKPDSEPKAAEATETTNPSLSESSVVSESKPAEETQKTNSQASEEAIVEAKENKEPEKADQPVTKQENYQLNYDQPTAPSYDGWEKQALPVGNGEMGAKVFGLIGEERIQYNEKTLWSGGPQPDSTDYNGGNYKDRYKVLAEIRKALEAGDRQKAKQLAEQNLVGPNNAQYGRYLAFGDIFMVFNNQKKGLDTVTDYHRGLDITEATTTTSYTQDGTTFKRETFSSYPDDITVTHLTKKGNKTLDFTLWNSLTEDLLANGNYSWEYSNYKNGHVTTDANGILLKGTVKDNGLKFASYLGIKTDGKVTVQDKTLTVTGASYATLYLSAKTNFAQNPKTNYQKDIDLEKTVKGIVEAAKAKDYETLKKAHIKDYQSLFNRVKLNLGGSKTAQTTKEALQSYNPSKGQKLEELFFQYGRYLLISSSRDRTDALPANLQGVWNAVDNPPWNADYHLNVNLQMNYWPAYMSNLAETAKPMINYIDDMRYYGRIAAKEYAGIESKDGQESGWLVHTQATPFGWTTPGWNYYWGWSPAANAWMMQNVYDYYKFTKDETYLKEKIYPMLKETAKFWNSFLHYDKASDRWVSSPSYSPEHGTITIGNTFDQSLVWQLFHDYMEVANHLNVDKDLVTEVKAKFDKLKPLHINKEGRIKEWYEEDSPQFTNEGIENHHRHVSHLVGLFPGTLFSKDQAEYLEAARATLNHRGDGGTGWSKANKINLWARLLDGNRAHRLLAEQLKYSTLENLWDTHAPFQIDGNFGATSGMAEMLLQSHTGYIAPLPALPDTWKDGQVSGLVARGNFEVSMKWKDKNLQSLSFLSNDGGDLVVDYPNIEASQIKVNGKPVKATILKNNRIQLATQKGDVITFEHFPGRVTSLTAVRQNGVTAELTFNQVEGATHYVIQRQVKDENGQTSATREFVTNQTHFIDRSLDPQHAYTYTVKAMLGDLATQVSEQATVETNRKAGNAIEAYTIQGNTTSSPIVAVFTKKDEKKVDEKQPTTNKGDEPAPTVEKPEYTKPIGTAGQEEAPIVEKPEYTEPIGTSGDQAAPTLSLPDYPVQVLKDKETGVEIIGGASDLEGISHVSSRRVLAQELFGKTYDAYDLQLKNPTNNSLQPKGSVLVRLPVSASVENIYYITPTKELQALYFTVREGKVEFITNHFSTYAVVYQATGTSSNTEDKPSASDTETLAHEAEQLSASPSFARTGNHSSKEELPATGEASNPLLFLAGLSLALTATFMLNGRKDESN